MPNYGFAIDLRKCIGCHACTIACKAEHEIPVGVNRCWVKTVEKGTFPDTRRFFFPVLCNQCDDAPCAKICPTNALFKRRDGIVDLHGDSCIGCRACMVACPYDQLFIDPNTHTAEKCNFCANRVENDLLPACVSVCPTECRIFGDLDDPTSEVAQIAQREATTVRKPEKGTDPEGLLHRRRRERDSAGDRHAPVHLQGRPGAAAAARVADAGSVAARRRARRLRHAAREAVGPRHGAVPADQGDRHRRDAADARSCWWLGDHSADHSLVGPAISLVFIIGTAVLLVVDLERPERFYYILVRPNWRSWMVWGAYFLTAHGAISALWIAAAWLGLDGVADARWSGRRSSSRSWRPCYTGFLFAQGLARDLWQGPQRRSTCSRRRWPKAPRRCCSRRVVPGGQRSRVARRWR